MKNLSLFAAQFMDQKGQLQAISAPEQKTRVQSQNWPCMWCDITTHTKRECSELDEVVKKGLVKFVGEVGMKKIAFPDNDEPIPFNNNKGGMKALAERRASKRSADEASSCFADASADANVFHFEADPMESLLVFKKQLADKVREKTGWDVPVLISSITVEVDAAWKANVDDKRKGDEAVDEEPRKKERQRRDDAGPSAAAPVPPLAPKPVLDSEDLEKPTKNSPRWILGRDVDQVIFPEVMAKKFSNLPVQGFTNGDLFGSMRRDIQEAILLRSKRKWILKEGPSNLLGILFGEEDGEESKANIFATKVEVCEEELQETSLVSSYRSSKNCLDGFWARACSECEVELLGAEDMVKALIDSGSEMNLMSKEVYEEGGWLIDRDIDWKINFVNSTKNPLFGACLDVKVKFGNVVEPQTIFVKDTLPYPVILGQPFITALRMETKVLDDGTHMAKIQSRDGLRVVEFPTVLPNHGKNQKELRFEPEPSHWSLGNGLVPR
ncbi:unnamed protein product [Calypogeia fissa]